MGEIGNKKMFLDSVFAENKGGDFLVLSEKYRNIKDNFKTTLFYHGRIAESFFTEDSKLYITPKEQSWLEKGIRRNESVSMDGIGSRIVANYREFRPSEKDLLYRRFLKSYEKIKEFKENVANAPKSILNQLSMAKLWNLSIASAVIVGMISMTFIYRYLGVGASALGDTQKTIANAPTAQVLGEEDIKNNEETVKYIQDIMNKLEQDKQDEFEKEVGKMVKGYPIEKMLPYILKQDKMTAAFLIGIAKKESGWGEHVPVSKGQDCFNYWGYRGPNPVGSGGHSCFASREEAVKTVAKRIKFLTEDKKLDTPQKMVIWKCGSACSKDDQAAVRKWISDVDIYFKKLN